MVNQSTLPDIDLRQFITVHQNQPITTSLRVSEAFGRRHADVLKTIENLSCSAMFTSANFFAHVEPIKAGAVIRDSKVYEMTKDGFIFLVMGFTGAKAAATKEAYIAAFNMMEQALTQNTRIAPDMVAISNQEYIELLKTKIALLEQKPADKRKRLTAEEKQRINTMHAAGMNTVEIGRQLNRPAASIRSFLHKDGV